MQGLLLPINQKQANKHSRLERILTSISQKPLELFPKLFEENKISAESAAKYLYRHHFWTLVNLEFNVKYQDKKAYIEPWRIKTEKNYIEPWMETTNSFVSENVHYYFDIFSSEFCFKLLEKEGIIKKVSVYKHELKELENCPTNPTNIWIKSDISNEQKIDLYKKYMKDWKKHKENYLSTIISYLEMNEKIDEKKCDPVPFYVNNKKNCFNTKVWFLWPAGQFSSVENIKKFFNELRKDVKQKYIDSDQNYD